MRQSLLDQLPLVPAAIDHAHARELAAMSKLLEQLAEAVRLVHEDLSWRVSQRLDAAVGLGPRTGSSDEPSRARFWHRVSRPHPSRQATNAQHHPCSPATC